MALESETDPIQATIDALAASTDADYTNPNAKPERIARSDEYAPSDKAAYELGDALYVYGVGENQLEPLDGSGDVYEERAEVAIDIWTLDGASVARSLAEDVRGVLNAYWTDNLQETAWVTIRVTAESDYTHETFRENPGQHSRYLVRATFMRQVELG